MFDFLKKKPVVIPQTRRLTGFFSTDFELPDNLEDIRSRAVSRTFGQQPVFKATDARGNAIAMDDALDSTLSWPSLNIGESVSTALIDWYGSQSFIGYQTCAMFAQHWLIDKICTMPARDACRNHFELTVTDGTAVGKDVLDYIRKRDQQMKLRRHLVELEKFNRVFGIRIALPIVESDDPKYLEKPYNPDGVKMGSYKGISQIDPYWITPVLDQGGAFNPSAMNFYEPEWWTVNGQRIHHSHLIIARNGEVPDLLKPQYQYAGISIPQKIAERVYAAERTANEAPLLTMSKRTNALKVDLDAAALNQAKFDQKMQLWTMLRNNYGVKVLGENETLEQFDTQLNDLDAVIMTQYQICCAIGGVPATKVMGTTPKGFAQTGEYDEASYGQDLESIQEHNMSPLVERHHELLILSEVIHQFPVKRFECGQNWLPTDSPTALEDADLNLKKAQTDVALVNIGALDGQDVRDRLIQDRNSGYNGIQALAPEPEYEDDEPMAD